MKSVIKKYVLLALYLYSMPALADKTVMIVDHVNVYSEKNPEAVEKKQKEYQKKMVGKLITLYSDDKIIKVYPSEGDSFECNHLHSDLFESDFDCRINKNKIIALNLKKVGSYIRSGVLTFQRYRHGTLEGAVEIFMERK